MSDDYEIGILRAKYLDLANLSFAGGHYVECEGMIKNFLDTIPDDKKCAEEINVEFDKINERKIKQKDKLKEYLKDKGELEKTDLRNQGESEITIEALHDQKTVCWVIAMKHGLLHE